MLDPFRGEMTANHVHEDDLRWAARERLLRQSTQNPSGQVPAHREAKRSWLALIPALGSRRAALKA